MLCVMSQSWHLRQFPESDFGAKPAGPQSRTVLRRVIDQLPLVTKGGGLGAQMFGQVSFLAAMQPRDHRAAGRTVSVLGMVAAGVTLLDGVGQLVTGDANPIDIVITIVIAALIVAVAWTTRRLGAKHSRTWAAAPFVALAAIVGLDFFSRDASLAAQVFLLFPALYAASQLRREGVVLAVAATIAAELLITFGMQPWQQAIIDSGYMTAAIVTTAALLTVAEEHREQLITLLERQAAIDPLTGLVTRRVLDDAARAALSGAASAAGTALILIDVDNFKAINDTYGHPGGDEILVQLAAALIESSRPTDIVSRLGGDEIAMLLPGCSAQILEHRAGQLLAQLRARRFVLDDGRRVAVSVSGGLAHAPTDAVDLRSLYAAADGALYQAKGLGRNQFCAASPLV
jgi:diguanylate cyclase (GGDEF)-like protein